MVLLCEYNIKQLFMTVLASIIRIIFSIYTFMILIKVIGSWFPQIQNNSFMRFISFYTDPYLNIFRRFIPPIGGMIDISPLIAFFVLQFLQWLLLKIL